MPKCCGVESLPMEPVIMWEPNTGKHVRVKTTGGYERYLQRGYVYLMDVADQKEEVE